MQGNNMPQTPRNSMEEILKNAGLSQSLMPSQSVIDDCIGIFDSLSGFSLKCLIKLSGPFSKSAYLPLVFTAPVFIGLGDCR